MLNPKVSLLEKTGDTSESGNEKIQSVKYVNKYFCACSMIPRMFMDGSSLSGVLEVSVSLRHVVRGADRNSDALRLPLRHSDKHADAHTQLLKRHFGASLQLPRLSREGKCSRRESDPISMASRGTPLYRRDTFILGLFIVVKCSFRHIERKLSLSRGNL